jgi:hypothetical protein
MSDQAIIVPDLYLFYQFQVLLAHFEKDFDVPAFAVQPNDFFIREGQICRQKCKPATFFITGNKNNFLPACRWKTNEKNEPLVWPDPKTQPQND